MFEQDNENYLYATVITFDFDFVLTMKASLSINIFKLIYGSFFFIFQSKVTIVNNLNI